MDHCCFPASDIEVEDTVFVLAKFIKIIYPSKNYLTST